MKIRIYLIVAGIIALGLLTSCGSHRKAVKPGVEGDNPELVVPGADERPEVPGRQPEEPEQGPAAAAAAILAPLPDMWSSVEVPFSLRLEHPTSIGLSGRARMLRGRAIDLSIRVLGFEVARLMVTPDSLFAMYKPDRIYLAESIESVTRVLPATISNLQDILTGRPFVLGAEGEMTVADLAAMTVNPMEGIPGAVTIEPTNQPEVMNYGFVASPSSLTNFGGASTDGKVELVITYSGPVAMRDVELASVAAIALAASNTKIAGEFDWRWNSAKWDSPISILWSTPSGYRRVAAADLLKMLKLSK